MLVATNAFGLGIDICDIENVILYGCPDSGLMFSQLSGRGAQNRVIRCVSHLLYMPGEVKEADEAMQIACSEELCLRKVLLDNVLQSTEIFQTGSDS